MAHPTRMRYSRRALLALMMVLMLPWGALNAWVPTASGHDLPHAQMATFSVAPSQTSRTCRNGFLPGAGCAKFLVGADGVAAAAQVTAALTLPRQIAGQMQTRPAPPQGPPRTV